MNKWHTINFFSLLLLSCYYQTTFAQPSDLLAHWTELGPNNRTIVRAITARTQCPVIHIDGRAITMAYRAKKSAAFPVTSCEITIPPATTQASLENNTLPLPKKALQRIVILGDTGCRLKKYRTPQACNDPSQWPFEKIATEAASWKPDLVIHVGDYLYRETACPANQAGCKNTPYGDNWATWHADFFKPAEKLLQAAPWIMVRGNHEDCQRAKRGWFRFLSPFSFPNACRSHDPIYTVSIDDIVFAVIDSSTTQDLQAPPKSVQLFRNDLRKIPSGQNVWLLSHKPVWAFTNLLENTLQAAARNTLPANVNLIIAGHIHLFQTMNFNDGRPPQIIVGTGGTRLDTGYLYPILNLLKSPSAATSKDSMISQFGYLVLERTEGAWKGHFYGLGEKLLAQCELKNRYFTCVER